MNLPIDLTQGATFTIYAAWCIGTILILLVMLLTLDWFAGTVFTALARHFKFYRHFLLFVHFRLTPEWKRFSGLVALNSRFNRDAEESCQWGQRWRDRAKDYEVHLRALIEEIEAADERGITFDTDTVANIIDKAKRRMDPQLYVQGEADAT